MPGNGGGVCKAKFFDHKGGKAVNKCEIDVYIAFENGFLDSPCAVYAYKKITPKYLKRNELK